MIPIKIQLKNFLSYGSDNPTIEFGNYHLICLSGKNGHGKSALLDAITWAVWGHARKASGTTKADTGLIRLGQSNMSVIFDFYFNGQKYRIRRETSSLYGKNSSVLDFGIIKEDKIIALTDKTIKQTQDAIIKLIGLDYNSFINSAFIRQGSSNEFSKKTPKERKDILASILNLDQYEELRTAALEEARTLDRDFVNQEKLLLRIDEDLKSLDSIIINQEIYQRKEQLDNEEKKIREDLNILEDQEKKIYHELNKLAEYESKSKSLSNQIANIKHELISIKNSFDNHQKDLVNIPKNINNYDSIKKDYDQIEYQHEQIKLTEKIIQEKSAILVEKKSNFEIFKEKILLNLKHQESELKSNQDFLIKQRQDLGDFVRETNNLQAKDQLSKKINSKYQQIIRWQNYLDKYNKDLITYNNQLENITYDSECILCLQKIDEKYKDNIKTKTLSYIKSKKYLINKIETNISSLKFNYEIYNQEYNSLLKKIEIEANEIAKNCKRKQLDEAIIKSRKKLTEFAKERETEIKKLDSNEYINEILLVQKELDLLKKNVSKFDYEKYNNLYQRYKKISELKGMQEKRNVLVEIQKERVIRYSETNKNCKLLTKELDQLPRLNVEYLKEKEAKVKLARADISSRLNKLKANYEYVAIEIGKIKQAETQSKKLCQEKNKIIENLENLKLDLLDYKNIAQMMGKDGIQAILIEEAIPELENEANMILARLTDNQCQIIIDSLKDLKKGGTKETLDIKISDSIGVRPYEMFSGGEAFRIDFALRIALSKLLARRAGTSLQTLIIDEGFGSQDDDGLNNIMESIYKIQDDFAKIIIVSHLPIMKEQFPVHFMVEKGPTGSAVKIIEHS